MGFGLLVIGFFTLIGAMPDSFLYYNYFIIVPIIGSLCMLYGFCRLQFFSVYFRIMKYLTLGLCFIFVVSMPFMLLDGGRYLTDEFITVFKIIRILYYFVFLYFLLQSVYRFAAELQNIRIVTQTDRNIKITYVYFSITFIPLFMDFGQYIQQSTIIFLSLSLIYFFIIFINLISCFKSFTYEGHDEEQDKKYKLEKRERSPVEKKPIKHKKKN